MPCSNATFSTRPYTDHLFKMATSPQERKKKGKERKKKEGRRKLLEVIDMFMILTAVMVSLIYTYLQAHQILYLNMISFLHVNYTSIK